MVRETTYGEERETEKKNKIAPILKQDKYVNFITGIQIHKKVTKL